LRLEALEDRLAPAAVALPLATDATPPIHPHALLSQLSQPAVFADSRTHDAPANSRLLLLAAVAIRHDSGQKDGNHTDGDNHPFFAGLASHLLSLNLVAFLPHSTTSDFTGVLSSLSPTTGTAAFVSTTQLPTSNPASNAGLGFPASAFVVPPGQTLASSGSLPMPAETPSFSAIKPPAPKPSTEEGPLAFELSPFAPLGLGIAPIPVPRGLEESLADQFGNPAPTTPASDPAPFLLGKIDGSDPDAVRAGVIRMLQENASLPSQRAGSVGDGQQVANASGSSKPAKSVPVESIPPLALPEGAALAGSPLDPACDAEGNELPRASAVRSILALFAVSVGLGRLRLSVRRTPSRKRLP
jgi:hypothetical protein